MPDHFFILQYGRNFWCNWKQNAFLLYCLCIFHTSLFVRFVSLLVWVQCFTHNIQYNCIESSNWYICPNRIARVVKAILSFGLPRELYKKTVWYDFNRCNLYTTNQSLNSASCFKMKITAKFYRIISSILNAVDFLFMCVCAHRIAFALNNRFFFVSFNIFEWARNTMTVNFN